MSSADATRPDLAKRRSRRARAWVRRRGWVLVVTVVLATLVSATLGRLKSHQYRSAAVVVVISGASDKSPGSANDAAALGVTYAGLIPQDTQILAYMANELHTTPAAVEHEISVTIAAGTSLLDLTFTNPDPAVALQGAQLLAKAVSGPAPVTPTVVSGTLQLVHLPTTANSTASASQNRIILGVILGLVLGAALIVTWERSDPRVDEAAGLAAETNFPVWETEELNPVLASALVARWRELAGGKAAKVALIAVGDHPDSGVASVARSLKVAARDLPPAVDADQKALGDGLQLETVPFHVGSAMGGGSASLVGADLTVLVVQSGTPVREVLATIATLEELGIAPAWGFVVPRRGPQRELRVAGPASSRGSHSRDRQARGGPPQLQPLPTDSGRGSLAAGASRAAHDRPSGQ